MGRLPSALRPAGHPTLPIVAFGAGREVPEGLARIRTVAELGAVFAYPFNLTQQPAASVPCGFTDAVCRSGSSVGSRGADALVLRAAPPTGADRPRADRRPTGDRRLEGPRGPDSRPVAGDPLTTGEPSPVANPYAGDVVAEVPRCGPDEVDRACTPTARRPASATTSPAPAGRGSSTTAAPRSVASGTTTSPGASRRGGRQAHPHGAGSRPTAPSTPSTSPRPNRAGSAGEGRPDATTSRRGQGLGRLRAHRPS
ncbi:MAG: hypothetical protein U5R31_07060 [Acidimicrobiia bacterium]|nr:hypothetical protein [Acidimicrobiia bacterium]